MKKRSLIRLPVLLSLAVCVVALAAFVTCGTRSPGWHVIVISLDTTRQDHFGCYGNDWIKTPRIDAIAAESFVFTNMLVSAPTTLASHTSLLTGKYPHTHGAGRNGFEVPGDNVLLAEVLKDAGYKTAAFIGAFPLADRFGMAQGFDVYDQKFDKNMLTATAAGAANERTAKSVTDAAIEYLENEGIPQRLFLFAHYYDPHDMYASNQPFYGKYQESRAMISWASETQGINLNTRQSHKRLICQYASEVSYMDRHVGRLLERLREFGILDRAIVVITSDHGENLIDHEVNFSHGETVYGSTTRGVLIVRVPGDGDKQRVNVDGLVSNIDVMPTILNLLAMEPPGGVEGEAVALTGERVDIAPRVRFCQATKPHRKEETDPRWLNMRKARCVVDGDYKFIQTPWLSTEELYDLSADPYESNNLLSDPTPEIVAVADSLRAVLLRWAESADPLPQPGTQPKEVSEDTMKRLKALGYVE